MWFYGAIEQLLSGWVFELIPGGEADFERAREMVVETICGARAGTSDAAGYGLLPGSTDKSARAQWTTTSSERLVWTGLLAATGALASVAREPGRRR